MRIITADETGLIKQILIENKRIVDFLNGWLSYSNDGEHKVETTLWREWCGLVCLVVRKTRWLLPWCISFFFIRLFCSNGRVQVWDVDKTVIVKEFSGIEGIPRGLGVIRNEEYCQ